ncbi:DivIVA domain-containing protein [bacterium]|nr:DivIVA domain-containing protein [bacterium]RQV97957.1 MAG: DivIVA domain-containing protein [bacterium]
MRLTPLEIKKQRFKTKVRGFDPMEVEAFLEMLADEYETVLNERNRLSEELSKLKTQLRDYQQVEKTLQETLMNAQENVNQARENSKREAQIVIREAELKSERILDDAREKLDKMKNEYSILKAQKESFAKRLKHLLQSQMELIRVLEMDDVGFVKAIDEKAQSGIGEETKATPSVKEVK